MSSESALHEIVQDKTGQGGVGPRICPIADAMQLIGDRWALLALREINLGVTKFNDICRNTGAPRGSIATRLRDLEDAGLIERRRYSERPPRDEYLFTESGRDLVPVLRELYRWGERHASPRVRQGG